MVNTPHTRLARQLIALFEERRTAQFAQAAETMVHRGAPRECVQNGLVEIALAEHAFEELGSRDSALKIIELLGFANSANVRRELFRLFTTAFDRDKLAHLASLEALPRSERCGTHHAEIRFLRSLLRCLLCVKGEPGLSAARLVIEVFDGTDFGRKVANMLK